MIYKCAEYILRTVENDFLGRDKSYFLKEIKPLLKNGVEIEKIKEIIKVIIKERKKIKGLKALKNSENWEYILATVEKFERISKLGETK